MNTTTRVGRRLSAARLRRGKGNRCYRCGVHCDKRTVAPVDTRRQRAWCTTACWVEGLGYRP